MSILFAHERASFAGGVEQNIADTVHGLRSRSVPCHLAYNPYMPADSSFLSLFSSVHPCNELSTGHAVVPTPTLLEIAVRSATECVYLHKLPRVPDALLDSPIRTVQMVHDHDLCCPRRHKYYIHNNAVCASPLGWRCYLDGAFMARDPQSKFGFRYESIERKREELQRRHRLHLSLVASEFMRQELTANGFPKDRVHVLPIAVGHSELQTSPIPSAIPTVLYVGQLIRGKGVDLLLRALARLNVPFRALIVGRGNAETALHKLSRELGIDSKVEFTGWVNNQELPRYYSDADVVAVPSRWPEPFGMVGLEAMRHGKPVVAFDVGGIRDWLDDQRTGLLVPERNVEAFASALQILLGDRPAAARFGAAGSVRLRSHFLFDMYIDRLQQFLLPAGVVSTSPMQMEFAR